MRPVALLFAVWLAASGAVGCGELRRTLDGGGHTDGATSDRAPSPDAAGDGGARDVAVDQRDARATDAGPGPDGGGAPNSTSCGLDDECASGHCVDGVCCNDACPGQCEACDVATLVGICAPVPAGPPHGTRSPCGGTGTCAGECGGVVRTACSFPGPSTSCRAQSCSGTTKTRAAGCDGLGSCPAAETVTCPQGCAGNDCLGACASDADCAAAGQGLPYCDAGTCTLHKPNGRTCAAGAECTSGRCVDGYCCNTDCAAQCNSCKEPGSLGTCITVVGDPRTGDTPARAACAGSGACRGQCDGVAATCKLPTSSTSCGSASCSAGTLTPVGGCDGAGSCSQPQMACASNYCGSPTACGPCPNDAACGTGKWCDAGTCRNKGGNAASCTANVQCSSGNCVPSVGGTGSVCCATPCSGATPACTAAGSACVCTGTSCGSGSVCFQASCCTPSPCTGCLDTVCQPGCGLAAVNPTCSGTCCSNGFCCPSSAVCCNGACCAGNCCDGITCTTQLCP